MTPPHLLLTGATGLLGRYLLRDLTARGLAVAVLVRGGHGRTPADRLAELAQDWADPAGPPPHLIEGDLTAPGLGLTADGRRWLARHCRQVVHSGASLQFVGPDRSGEPWRTNVDGTAELLAVCREAEVERLHHVSTAYVCGDRNDLVREDDPLPAGGFRNDYEAAKAEAERLVRAAKLPLPPTVLRPAIIVGDSRTGYTSTYHGLYLYMQFLVMLARGTPKGPDGRWPLPLRLDITGDEHRNLVPVDWVSAVAADVIADPRLHGRTYHLAPDRPATARELGAALQSAFGYTGLTFAGPDPAGPRTDLEALFYRFVATYAPYWRAEPHFDTAHTRAAAPGRPCPPVDAALIRRLVEFAAADGWGRRKAAARLAA